MLIKPSKPNTILIAYFIIDSNLPSLEKRSVLFEFNLNSANVPTLYKLRRGGWEGVGKRLFYTINFAFYNNITQF